jgi:hypothetical protein
MSREEVEMRARWQREREELIAQRFFSFPAAADYVRERVEALLAEQVSAQMKALLREANAPALVIEQPTPVAQPAEVAKELVLA